MKKQFIYLTLLCCLFSPLFLKAQTISPHLDSVAQKLKISLTDYYERYPREKIFIHTDQNVYLSGQTLWYKAYTMAYGKPSDLSKIIYVRLLDANGKLIKQEKLPVRNNTAYGNINLSDSLRTGWCTLKSFTAWMLNFDAEGLYHQKIYIRNIKDTLNAVAVATKPKTYHVNFYPEGGDIIDGSICNIAFKAVNDDGSPVNITGDVLENKISIGKLITVHDGMGSFQLGANINSSYTVSIHLPDSSVQNIALPAVKKTGISMRVSNVPADELEIKIPYNEQADHKDILITAEQVNGLNATYPLELSKGINIFNFKKSSFSTGILRLTVFDNRGLPLAERIVYINNNDQLSLSLTKNTLSFDPKSKNVLSVHLKDDKGQPVAANLSVSVVDAGVGTMPSDNISSYFLMSSELRGKINQPAYYFKNNSDTLQQQLDLVMLTNGWRHFKWDTISNGQATALKYFVERTQLVAGKIENYNRKDNFKIKLMITGQDSSSYIGFTKPDNTGLFMVKHYNEQGEANIFYEVIDENNRKRYAKVNFFKQDINTAQILKENIKSFVETAPVISKTFLDSVSAGRKTNFLNGTIDLKEVNIRERKPSLTDLLVKNHVKRLTIDDGYTLDLVNSYAGGKLMDYIIGRFPGLDIKEPFPDTYTFTYRGASTLGYGGTPFIYLDEAQVTLGDVLHMSLSDIALIRYAPPPAWFAPLGGGDLGAILIYTKTIADDAASNKSRIFDKYTFNGYSVTREFPSPDYSTASQTNAPDYRTTLYWNHDLTTDLDGDARIRFYNSDNVKKYRIIIQAMDANGKVGYLTEEISGK